MTDASTTPVLTGTLLLTPFGDPFSGVIEADGQEPRVAACFTAIDLFSA